LFSNSGGDTVQVLNTSKFLKRLNIECDIKLCNESIDYRSYDLIHFFNIIRPADILHHIKKAGKPYVVSTIYVDYSEFDQKVRKGVSGLVFRVLPASLIEYLKVIARAIINREKIVSLEYLWVGHTKAIKKIIGNASLLLPNSVSEYKRLLSRFGMEHPYRVIPNAIDEELFEALPSNIEKDNLLVLCVGRIEGLKNQLNLIRALNGTKYQLYIIGAFATNQKNYYEECRKEAANNIHFIKNVKQEELVAWYRKAKVHALPSWFETTGLSTLEAAAMGCNVVITDKGDTREYLEDMAYYCDPASPDSIKEAIDKAVAAPLNENLQKKIRKEYTWSVTARKTAEAYKAVLSNKVK
jgi:glycosyltransferase involved in cell wall biosynthesis